MVDGLQSLNRAKIAPPALHRYVNRPRLRILLSKGLQRKLTVICASAGFGKTTLLCDFLKHYSSRVVWYRLDESDRDVAQFATYLVSAIEEHYYEWGQRSLRTALRLNGSIVSRRRLAEVLSDELNLLPDHQLVIALDGYESINCSPEISELVSYLLDYSPSHLHFFITSRESPALPLSRLRAQNDLVEILEGQLAFTAAETDALINQFDAVCLNREERQFLLERTEGWPAGLVIALQWLQRVSPAGMVESLKNLGGGVDQVYGYLAEEVFRSLDMATQDFLMKTSIFEEQYVDACNALLDVADSRSRLSVLEANGLFTTALGDGHTHFRYHQLFRDFLLAKLHQQLTPQEASDLHRRAGRAMEARGLFLEAVRHYLAGGLPEAAVNVLENVNDDLTKNDFSGVIARCLELLPVDLFPTHPWLLVLKSRLLRRNYRLEEAREALDQAAVLFKRDGDRDGLVWVACEFAHVFHRQRVHLQAVSRLENALDLASGTSLRNEILWRLTTNYGAAGRLYEAAQAGEMVLAQLEYLPHTPGNVAVELTILSSMARVYAWLGRWDDARGMLNRANDLCQNRKMSDILLGRSYRVAAEVLIALGEPQAALEQAEQAIKLLGEDLYFRERLNLLRADALIELGMYREAEASLDKAGPESKIALALLRLRQGRPREALGIAHLAWSQFASSETALDRESVRVMLGLAHIASGCPTEARPYLQEASRFFYAHGYAHCLASVWWHLAWLEFEDSHPQDAASYLGQALELMAARGFRHIRWWLPYPGAWLCVRALRAGMRDDLVCRLAAEQLHDDECLPLACLLEPSYARLHSDVVSSIRFAAGPDSDFGRFIDEILYCCRDDAISTYLCGQVAEGRLIPGGLLRLRRGFELTWKEIHVLVNYYMEPLWSGIPTHRQWRRRCSERLHLAENTLKVHLANLRRKLALPEGAASVSVYRRMQELRVTTLPALPPTGPGVENLLPVRE